MKYMLLSFVRIIWFPNVRRFVFSSNTKTPKTKKSQIFVIFCNVSRCGVAGDGEAYNRKSDEWIAIVGALRSKCVVKPECVVKPLACRGLRVDFLRSSTAISNCIHISLLRLQTILLANFVTKGFVIPGIALLRETKTFSGAVVGDFAIYIAYAMVSSGHLPLMMPMLFIAFLAEGFVTRVTWAEKCLKATSFRNAAALEDKLLPANRLLFFMCFVVSDFLGKVGKNRV